MNKSYSLAVTTLVLVISSCMHLSRNFNPPLEKIWIIKKYEDSVITYKSLANMPGDSGVYQFKSGGRLTVKQNSSWCGTEPIHYEMVNGTWNTIADSVIRLEYPYWGGIAVTDFHVINISDSELYVKIIREKW